MFLIKRDKLISIKGGLDADVMTRCAIILHFHIQFENESIQLIAIVTAATWPAGSMTSQMPHIFFTPGPFKKKKN